MAHLSIRILIADDHAVVRTGLRALLERERDLKIVGEAVDGEEAVARVQALRPDVVLLDVAMPRKSGLAAIAEIKLAHPGVRVLVLSSFADTENVVAAIKAGALGYLVKDASPREIIQGIRDVARGVSSIGSDIARRLIAEVDRRDEPDDGTPHLTARETEVLKLLAQGLRNEDIAHALAISPTTVGRHVSTILEKLQLANRTQAALYALRTGLASLFDEPIAAGRGKA